MIEILNDRYRLGDVVGSGGMGAVYRATDLRLGRTVAVKILRGGPLADEMAQSRMRSEAVLAASINHSGVAQVFDFEEDCAAHGGLSYIVMELVEGHTLAELLHEQGRLPADQVMSAVVQVAEGLQVVHDAGIVHRDLKPSNIMLTSAGRTVLVDFGIARSATSDPLTATGSMVGTADYMSPEQAAGRSATPRSDLYALGIVAYHCLTGTPPFRREAHVATALAHLNEDLPPFPPDVPDDVAELVRSLTAKDPVQRPASAAAVAEEARRIGAAGAISLPSTFEQAAVDSPTVEHAHVGAVAQGAASASPRPPRRGRRPAVYAGVGAVAISLAVLGMQSMGSEDPTMVPGVVGMDAGDAAAEIREAGMTVSQRSVDIADRPAGQVVKQSPEGGEPEPESGPITISVVSGKVRVSAKDVIGTTYAKASTALEKLGFEVVRKDVTQASDTGLVVALDKSGRLRDGSTITLSVAVLPISAPTTSSGSGSGATKSTSGGSSKTGTGRGATGKSQGGKGKPKGKGPKK